MNQWGFSFKHSQIKDEFDSYGGLLKVDNQKKMQNYSDQPLKGYKTNNKKNNNKRPNRNQQMDLYEQKYKNSDERQQYSQVNTYNNNNEQQMNSNNYEPQYYGYNQHDNNHQDQDSWNQSNQPQKSQQQNQYQYQQQQQQQQQQQYQQQSQQQQYQYQQQQLQQQHQQSSYQQQQLQYSQQIQPFPQQTSFPVQPLYQNQFQFNQQIPPQQEQSNPLNIMQDLQLNQNHTQNDTGFTEVQISQYNQPSKNNSQINQSSQIPKSIITSLAKEEQLDSYYNSYHKLIDYFFQYADIEIKISNINPIVEPRLNEIYFDLKELRLKIQQIDIEDQLRANRTYQVKEQQENNISQKDKMIILHSLIIENLYREAENHKSKILISYQKYQYKINPLDQHYEENAKNFYLIFKKKWDNHIILIEQCKSEFEANSKIKLLKVPRINQSFCKELGFQNPIIMLTSDLNLVTLSTTALYNDGLALQKKTNEIIVINSFDQNQKENISTLNDKFQKFLQDPQYIKNVKETFDIDCQPQKDINEIDKCIQALQAREYIEITVTTPIFNLQNKGKYLVQAELQLWIEGYQTQEMINQKLKVVKQQLNEIYNPPIIIQVFEQEKINLWKNYLGSLFENQNNSKECITREDKGILTIELNGHQDVIYEKKEKIETLFKQFQCKNIEYQCENDILKVLVSKKAQLSKLFKAIFTEIASEFGQCQIQMIDVNEKSLTVIIEVYFNSIDYKFTNISAKVVQFLFDLDYILLKINFKEFLQFQGLKEIQFQEQYQVAVAIGKQKEVGIIGRQKELDEIKQMSKQFDQSKKENYTSIIIDCDNKLVFNRIKQLNSKPKQDANVDDENAVVISFPQENKIMIQASKKQIQQEKDKMNNKIQQFKGEISTKSCQFSDKEVKYIDKNFKSLLEKLQKNNEIIISTSSQGPISLQSEKSAACTLEYQNKKIQIIYGDISTIQCDAIVNSCNNKISFGDSLQLTGVAQSIFQLGGTQYSSACQEYIRKHYELEIGKVFTYKMPNDRQIKYILNVATPVYSEGFVTDEDLKKIQHNIEAIFKEINNLDVKTLTLPIFGGGACGYGFNQVTQVVLNSVINSLYFQKNSIEAIYIAELIDIKVDWLTKILKNILKPPEKERQVKYQWQWQDNQAFKNYDDEDINNQIDEAYEQFQQTGKDQKVMLKFPFSKQPGTHTVNLDSLIVTDISLKTTKKIISKKVSNSKRFYFDEDVLDDQQNEYLLLQELNNIKQFDIFYKKHYVEFKKGEMYQMNQETQFKRTIKPVQYVSKKTKSQGKPNKLVGKDFTLIESQNQVSKLVQQKSNCDQLTLQSFDGSLNEMIYKQVKAELEKQVLEFKFDVPNLSDSGLQEMQQFIQSIALSINGRFKQGEKILLKIFEKKKNKIVNYINSIKSQEKAYPDTWVPQSQNLLRTALQPNSQEYQKIANLFKKTDAGQIYEIYRIQNKSLWDNYNAEKNKLIEIHKQQGTNLKAIEIDRYLWHGVRTQHPQIIYSGLKEAFDQTYSNIGMWGAGIYFAENASYSRNYSYKLQFQDSANNVGKLIFLCCLVTTGRVEVRLPDQNIKRPSQGFDCVSGNTNGSDVFILYSMDIRRAYPAYEIIYT
ncbi:unnamed protein product (macronuclear) [Paramecium tetraurelia]|uniref:Poly [ADP-ribose] polymerase n=1 Tax=Paramecium tetraurelia TaxID=5888 RepID=A0BLG5_PARTE|nr:uncharacterized protein GSPATT00030015001 [Paramecium tetraurelia]CAK59382.1 unnamed protein product [Paramecium tetraurelia]|eukprot:XP_001426780.1 hypothetical protein (macronuclear) [Paramecium tetraurelia strain d4-2]